MYVSSPHSCHRERALLAISAGKSVLVEKPMALSVAEANEILAAPGLAGVTVMEAMKTRFLPRTDVVRQLLHSDVLGDIEVLLADFGRRVMHIPQLTDPVARGRGTP